MDIALVFSGIAYFAAACLGGLRAALCITPGVFILILGWAEAEGELGMRTYHGDFIESFFGIFIDIYRFFKLIFLYTWPAIVGAAVSGLLVLLTRPFYGPLAFDLTFTRSKIYAFILLSVALGAWAALNILAPEVAKNVLC